MMRSRTPATEALNKLLSSHGSLSSLNEESERVTLRGSVKRSSSHMGSSLDMTSLLNVSEQIEDCPSFPTIEWPSLENNQDATDLCAPETKRRCSGLVRSKTVSHGLSAKVSDRKGSCGSLC